MDVVVVVGSTRQFDPDRYSICFYKTRKDGRGGRVSRVSRLRRRLLLGVLEGLLSRSF